jgi:hypothetical protein
MTSPSACGCATSIRSNGSRWWRDPFTFQPQLLGGFGGEINLMEEPLKGPIIMIDRHGKERGGLPRLYQ